MSTPSTLDLGYRNKNQIGAVLDEMIASKLEEAQETGIYSSKDLSRPYFKWPTRCAWTKSKPKQSLEKAQSGNIKNQTNVQINESQYLLDRATMVS